MSTEEQLSVAAAFVLGAAALRMRLAMLPAGEREEWTNGLVETFRRECGRGMRDATATMSGTERADYAREYDAAMEKTVARIRESLTID